MRKSLKKPHPKGLTLIELLLAVSLFSVIGTILYSILSQGTDLWRRSQEERDRSSEERIILEKISNDLRTGFIHQWIRFAGEAQEIYFCGLRDFSARGGSASGGKEDLLLSAPRLAKVHYYFLEKDEGPQKRGLYLAEYPIEQQFLESPPLGKLISNSFKDFHFEFGYWDSLEEKITMEDRWIDSEKIPRIVVLKGTTDRAFVKTVVLPLGELIEFNEEEESIGDENE